jgi:hypothetical protein
MPLRNKPNPTAITVLTTVAVAGVTALGLAACGSGGSSQGSVTTADVTAAQTRITGATSPCPFSLDVAAAAKKAGVTGAVTAGAEDGTTADGTVHPAEAAKPLPTNITPEPGMPSSIPAQPAWTDVECDYRVGAVALDVLVVATPATNSAINMLVPVLQRDSQSDMAGLTAFVKNVPKPGDVRLGPGTVPAAVIRVPVKGSGDIAMLVGQEAKDGAAPLSSDAIRGMAGELAKEIHG